MRYNLADIPDHCDAGGKSTLLVSSGKVWSEAGPRSRGEGEGARERERKEGGERKRARSRKAGSARGES